MFPVAAAFGNPPAGAASGYTIANSCRFNDDDTAYLSRTFGTTGDRRTWTWSGWIKRGNLGSRQFFFSCANGSSQNSLYFEFNTSDNLDVSEYSTVLVWKKTTTSVYRDPSAWYHIVVQYDTTQAVAADRIKLSVNGVRVTAFGTNTDPSLNYEGFINTTTNPHNIGRINPSLYFDGYMAEVVFIDGQALDPTSFGAFNANGVWVPKDVSGLTYGTNGFHLDFADSSDIGNDVSGNGNDFTPSGLAAEDIVIDTPTNNFATLSSIAKGSQTLSDGNLLVTAGNGWAWSTFGMTTGKWYCEGSFTADASQTAFGFHAAGSENCPSSGTPGYTATSYSLYTAYTVGVRGLRHNSSLLVNITSLSGTTLQMAVDLDAGHLWFGVNDSWYDSGGTTTGDPSTGANPTYTFTPGTLSYFVAHGNLGVGTRVNFGQSTFAYTPPTDFLALCTENLGTPTIADPSAHFDVALYTGNGTAIGSGGNEISDLSFQPDIVWIKNRGTTDQNILTDSVRGATKYLSPDGDYNGVEVTAAETLASFDTDGFTVGNDVQVNTNTENYIAWCWKAGGSVSVNGDGTISSTVSVNPTAGFSIVKYVGNGTGGATVGHGLGAVPGLIVVKNLDQADSWPVYHHQVASDPETDYFTFDTGAAVADLNTIWNDTAPTSTVFSVGTSHLVNASTENYIAYCFSEVDGFSRFGSYIGNGNADGPFVWCGFRPKYIFVKRTNGYSNWVWTSKTPEYNPTKEVFYVDAAYASTILTIDILSNGFKLRDTYAQINTSSSLHVFFAFAEHPFAYARAR
jgi:hypothetical protein